MKVLTINVSNKECFVSDNEYFSILDYSIDEHLKDKTYESEVFSENNSLIISAGPFTGLGIPGAHRVIISGRSPLTQGFFFSTIGGLGEELYRTSVDSVKIIGKAIKPSVILIKYEKNKLLIEIKEVNELFKIYKKNGVFSFQDWLIKKYSSFFKELRYRSIVAGPAGFNTNMGGLSSVRVINDELDYGSEGFAGRGGYGSVMAQAHNVAGIMFGGNFQKEQREDVKNIITSTFNNPNILSIVADKTEKYRGKGTLLSNYESSENDTLMFNWNSMYWSKEDRVKYYDKLIKKVFIKEYLKNKIVSKTCGETCPAVCKKSQKLHVKDYEPYSSCGPNLGIFTQEDAEKVVNAVDAMGFDAISFGNLLSCVFEELSNNVLEPDDFKINKKPVFNFKNFKEEDSSHNASIAVELIRLAGFGELQILKKGIRFFSEQKNIDSGVYFSFGSHGEISPNEYLRPGFIAPLPLLGKFTTFYDKGFFEPFEIGSKSAERLIKEFYNETLGFCRFHRGWAEKILPLMVNELVNKKIDFDKQIKETINKISKYNILSDSMPVKWVGKAKNMVYQHLKINMDEFGESETSIKWVKLFNNDYDKALNDYWNDLVDGISSVLNGYYEKNMKVKK